MTLHNLWQVDAFTQRLFGGNPAAVMVLQDWLDDDILQSIAAANNLAETAFLREREIDGGCYDLRWFTPGTEVPLCGHATLAAAHILWTECNEHSDRLTFKTRSGDLHVSREGHGYALDFPSDPPRPIATPNGLIAGLGVGPISVHAGQYIMAVMRDANTVRAVKPDYRALGGIVAHGNGAPVEACIVVTAPGDNGYDFISRFFGPTVGIDEDPVTGSAHCMLTPYWASILGKDNLRAFQASARGGEIGCSLAGDRVILHGSAVTYLRGQITL